MTVAAAVFVTFAVFAFWLGFAPLERYRRLLPLASLTVAIAFFVIAMSARQNEWATYPYSAGVAMVAGSLGPALSRNLPGALGLSIISALVLAFAGLYLLFSVGCAVLGECI